MAGSDIAIGAGEGLLTGATSGFMVGNWVGAIVGGAIGLGLGLYKGVKVDEGKTELEANQKHAADVQNIANETDARNKAAAMFRQAAADPRATSATMFKKAELQRNASDNYADIRDKAEPFAPVEKKQFYGNRAA